MSISMYTLVSNCPTVRQKSTTTKYRSYELSLTPHSWFSSSTLLVLSVHDRLTHFTRSLPSIIREGNWSNIRLSKCSFCSSPTRKFKFHGTVFRVASSWHPRAYKDATRKTASVEFKLTRAWFLSPTTIDSYNNSSRVARERTNKRTNRHEHKNRRRTKCQLCMHRQTVLRQFLLQNSLEFWITDACWK